MSLSVQGGDIERIDISDPLVRLTLFVARQAAVDALKNYYERAGEHSALRFLRAAELVEQVDALASVDHFNERPVDANRMNRDERGRPPYPVMAGVVWNRGDWWVTVRMEGQRVRLRFPGTPEGAALAAGELARSKQRTAA